MTVEETIKRIEAENEELHATIELIWDAQTRAIRKYQESTGDRGFLPDHAKLIEWMLTEIKNLRDSEKQWETKWDTEADANAAEYNEAKEELEKDIARLLKIEFAARQLVDCVLPIPYGGHAVQPKALQDLITALTATGWH